MPVGKMLVTAQRAPQCGKSDVFYAADLSYSWTREPSSTTWLAGMLK
jgi:hypothetical protein